MGGETLSLTRGYLGVLASTRLTGGVQEGHERASLKDGTTFQVVLSGDLHYFGVLINIPILGVIC